MLNKVEFGEFSILFKELGLEFAENSDISFADLMNLILGEFKNKEPVVPDQPQPFTKGKPDQNPEREITPGLLRLVLLSGINIGEKEELPEPERVRSPLPREGLSDGKLQTESPIFPISEEELAAPVVKHVSDYPVEVTYGQVFGAEPKSREYPVIRPETSEPVSIPPQNTEKQTKGLNRHLTTQFKEESILNAFERPDSEQNTPKGYLITNTSEIKEKPYIFYAEAENRTESIPSEVEESRTEIPLKEVKGERKEQIDTGKELNNLETTRWQDSSDKTAQRLKDEVKGDVSTNAVQEKKQGEERIVSKDRGESFTDTRRENPSYFQSVGERYHTEEETLQVYRKDNAQPAQHRPEIKHINLRFEDASFRFRFHNESINVEIRVSQDIHKQLSYLDVQRLSRNIESLGMSLEGLKVNGNELFFKSSRNGKRAERFNIKEEDGTGKEVLYSSSDSSDFSLLL
ncbi:hypothetical protein BCF55_1767 [Hydrogenivirga caldilitoris]|uniref:Flagellar hook-length control protein FliK n=1 Tax=Hydrogenivirga caldilitoris TaxID=246264 RepID=A0A497XR55_9AQUI|nr:hypothetical protein [Hydrogenivirga caldilitoris]RLJ71465.1 hypothetical protein BCF55_1767 [Hydrogenivirga caldilitoris]